jgi:hypothetical protein
MVEGAFSLQIGGAFKYEKKPGGALHVVILFYFLFSTVGTLASIPIQIQTEFLNCRHFCTRSLKL